MRKQTKLLLEENNRLEEALQPEARSLLTDVVVYLRGSRVSTWEQEQVRRDVTRMLLDAQARGEDAREVIGPDPRAFCDSVIEALLDDIERHVTGLLQMQNNLKTIDILFRVLTIPFGRTVRGDEPFVFEEANL